MTSEPLAAHQTLVGRIILDAGFRDALVADPRPAVAAAGILDVDDERLDALEALTVAERLEQVRSVLVRFHAERWTGWWGREFLDPEPED